VVQQHRPAKLRNIGVDLEQLLRVQRHRKPPKPSRTRLPQHNARTRRSIPAGTTASDVAHTARRAQMQDHPQNNSGEYVRRFPLSPLIEFVLSTSCQVDRCLPSVVTACQAERPVEPATSEGWVLRDPRGNRATGQC
jgi:hypothetical protein